MPDCRHHRTKARRIIMPGRRKRTVIVACAGFSPLRPCMPQEKKPVHRLHPWLHLGLHFVSHRDVFIAEFCRWTARFMQPLNLI